VDNPLEPDWKVRLMIPIFRSEFPKSMKGSLRLSLTLDWRLWHNS